MAKIWRNRIEAGDKLFQDCPDRYKEQVKALMRQDVTDGIITADRYEELIGEPPFEAA